MGFAHGNLVSREMLSFRVNRLLLKFFTLCVALVAALIIAEGLVLIGVGEQVKFPRRVVGAPWGIRYNEPGASYRHQSRDGTWYFKINHQGMRAERDYSYEKPRGVRRIVVLGDSFAIGYEVDVQQTFAMVLQRELRNRHPAVEVLNAGVSGFSTGEEAVYIERELIKYEPDVVVVSFYENDLLDNIRANLFRLDGDKLVVAGDNYVPAGRLGNFLNTNPVFNVLSERSNAFAFAKEQLTFVVKRVIERGNQEENAAGASKTDESESQRSKEEDYQRRLLAAIVNRMYEFLHARNIPLVILSIPHNGERALIERFPRELVDFTRPGLEFVSGDQALSPLVGTNILYNRYSLNHWTPIAHDAAGKAIARLSVWEERVR